MSSTPGAGHQNPSQPVSWTQRDVLLFANSIGCTVSELHFLYELHPQFSVFPTYPIILPFKGTSQEVIDFYAAQSSSGRGSIPGVPPLDSRRVVDGERQIWFVKPLPTTSAGREFEVKSQVLGVYDKGKPGTVMETELTLVEKSTGEVFVRVIGSAFFVGQGGWGGPKGLFVIPSSVNHDPVIPILPFKRILYTLTNCYLVLTMMNAGPKNPSFPPPESKSPDAIYTHPTTAESAHLYRLNGDYNPLHATPEPGAKMGFGGAIMHGLYSWNTTCHGLLKLLGGSDPANIKEFAARFASPVKPGDVLVTQIWRMGEKDADGFEEVRFVTEVKGGKVCLSNGRARVKVVGSLEDKAGKSKL